MSWRSYANKVKTRRCPFCGTERPLDWFIEIDKPTGDKRCWKCRELKKGEGSDRIG